MSRCVDLFKLYFIAEAYSEWRYRGKQNMRKDTIKLNMLGIMFNLINPSTEPPIMQNHGYATVPLYILKFVDLMILYDLMSKLKYQVGL